jgi:hypothetical protein
MGKGQEEVVREGRAEMHGGQRRGAEGNKGQINGLLEQ